MSLYNGTLYVSRMNSENDDGSPKLTLPRAQIGHENAALTSDRTLDSLYIQPLLKILTEVNPQNAFTVNSTSPKSVLVISSWKEAH